MLPNLQIARLMCCVVLGLGALGCDDPEPQDEYELVEYVKIEGRCHENHTQQWGNYRGEIVHWRNETDKTDSRYGSVTWLDALSDAALAESIEHPNRYQPPFIVSFDDIPAEILAQQKMVLAGVSNPFEEEGSDSPSYEATCEISVVERLQEFPPDAERW